MGECDLELLQRWRRGDPQAFETLVRSWQAPMARFLGRLTADRDLVPDLCQEVFLRVHRGRESFRGDAAFGTWLYRIAMNVARDAGRRSRRREASLNGREWIDARLTKRRHAAEKAELVANVLASLPEPQREALVLRHFERLSFEEMARVTGTPASTLKSRFSAGLREMRIRLGKLGIGQEELT